MVDYCELSDIKSRLLIDDAETTYDTELKGLRDDAEATIDRILKAAGETTPLTASNADVKSICADLAAGDFLKKRAPPGETNPFLERAKERLEEYKRSKPTGIAFIVGESAT